VQTVSAISRATRRASCADPLNPPNLGISVPGSGTCFYAGCLGLDAEACLDATLGAASHRSSGVDGQLAPMVGLDWSAMGSGAGCAAGVVATVQRMPVFAWKAIRVPSTEGAIVGLVPGAMPRPVLWPWNA